MGDTYGQARALRDLADAIDRRREANTLPGISAPSQIVFCASSGQPLEGYGNNPTLLKAVAAEVRLSWEELRTRALARLDASVEQLSAQVRGHLDPDTRGAGEG